MLKLEKSQYVNSIYQLNYTKYEKRVMLQNCWLHKNLQVWTAKYYDFYFFTVFSSINKWTAILSW